MTHKFDKKMSISRILNLLDHVLFFVFIGVLIVLIATSTKVNIATDSVDYYAILQSVTPEKEKPIVRNLHFVEQRSPGYSLLSLIPYSLLTVLVEPFVTTEKISEYVSSEFTIKRTVKEEDPIPPPPPRHLDETVGSEMMMLPPQPLLIKDLFFNLHFALR